MIPLPDHTCSVGDPRSPLMIYMWKMAGDVELWWGGMVGWYLGVRAADGGLISKWHYPRIDYRYAVGILESIHQNRLERNEILGVKS